MSEDKTNSTENKEKTTDNESAITNTLENKSATDESKSTTKTKSDKNKNIILIICAVVIVAIIACIIAFGGKKGNYENVAVTTTGGSTLATVNNASSNVQDDISITFTGDTTQPKDLDAESFAKTAYEMKCIFVFEPFDDISKVSANKMVQFCFSHMFYENLVDMPSSSKMVYRTAGEKDIKKQALKFFNSDKVDVKKSDLYNAKEKKLEMWQLNYNTDVYMNCIVSGKDDVFSMKCTIYKDKDKSSTLGEATIGIKKGNSGYYIYEYK